MRLGLVLCSLLASWAFAEPLKVVTSPMAPYQVQENGEVSGSNTLWVRQLLEEAELTADFAIYPWPRAYQLASSEPNVFIYALARTPEREAMFHWVAPIASFEHALLVRASQRSSLQQRLQQGDTLVLAVPRDHVALLFVQYLPEAEQLDIFYTASTDEAMRLLLNGRVDAVLENPQLTSALVASHPQSADALQVLLPIPASRSTAYLAASKATDEALVQRLQRAFQQLHGKAAD
ncbi:MAG: transporter substrate-binding domain-containing protein [Alkalimonas sp.]|nr:transporter substrate-binding domain-containing protein [Alkalimonas sp.]